MCDHGPIFPPGLHTQQSTSKVKRMQGELGHGVTSAHPPPKGITSLGIPQLKESCGDLVRTQCHTTSALVLGVTQ